MVNGRPLAAVIFKGQVEPILTLSHVSALTNSIINPLIYFSISETFQQDLQRACCRLLRKSFEFELKTADNQP